MNIYWALISGQAPARLRYFAKDGRVMAAGNGDYPVYYPHPRLGRSRIRTNGGAAICRTIPEVLDKGGIDPAEIKAVGIDGQSWSAIPVDRDGNVLARTPIWMDTRAVDICREYNEKIGKEKIFELCGNPLQPSYTTPKIIWYKRNLPEVYENTYKDPSVQQFYCIPPDRGVMSQELSQGYGLHCFDMKKGVWDEGMCREFGFSPDLLPDIYPCHAIIGNVTGTGGCAVRAYCRYAGGCRRPGRGLRNAWRGRHPQRRGPRNRGGQGRRNEYLY